MKEKLKICLKSPMFYMRFFVAVVTPILSYLGVSAKSVSSWGILIDIVRDSFSNPYILFLSAVNITNFLVALPKDSSSK